MEFSDDHAADETGEGDELVEPGAPELGHLGFRDCDSAEEGEGDDDEGVDEGADEGGGGECCDHLAEGYGKEFGDEDHEELVAGAGGGRLQAGHVIEGEEEADGAEDGVWHFCDD